MVASASKQSLDGHGPQECISTDQCWISKPNQARVSTIVTMSDKTAVENVFVKNCGAGLISVEILDDEDASWKMLLRNQTLKVDTDRNFLARFFDEQLSVPLRGLVSEKLRVTIEATSFCSSLIGLQTFRVNITADERASLKSLKDATDALQQCEQAFGTSVPTLANPFPPQAVVKKTAAKKTADLPEPKKKAKVTPPVKKKAKISEPKKVEKKKKAKKHEFIIDDDEEIDDILDDLNDNDDDEIRSGASFRPKKKAKPLLDTSNLFNGVVFTISGLANPERSDVRAMALGMGAEYSPNWGPNSTHLFLSCAGTPKHKEMQKSGGKGIALDYAWVEACHDEGKRISESKYAFDSKTPSPPNKMRKTAVADAPSFPSFGTYDDDDEDIILHDDDDVDANIPTSIHITNVPTFDVLPEIFSGISIFFSEPSLEMTYGRYVIGFGGKTTHKMAEATHYVAGNDDAALPKGAAPSLVVVDSDWIEKCVQHRKLM